MTSSRLEQRKRKRQRTHLPPPPPRPSSERETEKTEGQNTSELRVVLPVRKRGEEREGSRGTDLDVGN